MPEAFILAVPVVIEELVPLEAATPAGVAFPEELLLATAVPI